MFGIGGGEFLVIALVALLVFGPSRLPEVARNVARIYREFNRWRSRLDDTVSELRQEIDLNIDAPTGSGLSRTKPKAADKGLDAAAAPRELRTPVTQDINVPEWDDYLAPPSYEPAEDLAEAVPEAPAVAAGADDDYLAGGGDGR